MDTQSCPGGAPPPPPLRPIAAAPSSKVTSNTSRRRRISSALVLGQILGGSGTDEPYPQGSVLASRAGADRRGSRIVAPASKAPGNAAAQADRMVLWIARPARGAVGHSLKLLKAPMPSKSTLGSPQVWQRESIKKSRPRQDYDANRRHFRDKSGDPSGDAWKAGRPLPASTLLARPASAIAIPPSGRHGTCRSPGRCSGDGPHHLEHTTATSAGQPSDPDGRWSHGLTDAPETVRLIVPLRSRSSPCSAPLVILRSLPTMRISQTHPPEPNGAGVGIRCWR